MRVLFFLLNRIGLYIKLYINRPQKEGLASTTTPAGEVMASLMQRPGSPVYYIQYYLSRKLKRVSTGTDSYQIAQEKLRQFESAQYRGEGNPLPTRTLIARIVGQYVSHIR